MRTLISSLVVASLVLGCAARPMSQTTSIDALRIDAKRIDAERDDEAAGTAFRTALGQMKTGACELAIVGFDGVVSGFPASRYVSASLYNAGLCLQRSERWEESSRRYERLLEMRPGSPDTKHTRFQLAFLYNETHRFDEALAVADALLEHSTLSSDERIEAMARRAEALLGTGAFDDAEQAAEQALRFYRTRGARAELQVNDPFFAAAANYTLAEIQRLRSESIRIPSASAEAQHAVLERRAQRLLSAQRAYFDTIGFGDPYWASAAGYRIGAMYDGFWDAILEAPVATPETAMNEAEMELYRSHYRSRLAELARPLVRHAIRYWELTLAMVERTGVRSEWTERIHRDLAKARSRLSSIAIRPGPRSPEASSSAAGSS